jgi:hypothetical protein
MKGLGFKSLASISLMLIGAQTFIAAPALAQEPQSSGWFAELGIGSLRDRNDVNNGVQTTNTNYVQRAYLGYRFSDYMGVQGGFMNVNPIKYRDTTNDEDKLDIEGLVAKVYFNFPFSRDTDGFYALTLSAGGWRWDASMKGSSGDVHSTGIGPSASVGLLFTGRSSAIKLEYERFEMKPSVLPGNFSGGEKVQLKYDAIVLGFLFYL